MIIDSDVLGNEPQAPPVAPAQGTEENVTLSKAAHDALIRERDEARNSERYWAERARSGGNNTPAPAAENDDAPDSREFLDDDDTPAGLEDDTAAKLVDDFASQGVSALTKRGFITAADAKRIAVDTAVKVSRELIGRERQKMTSDAQIVTDFPELKDQTSELFKETAAIYQKALAMDPNAAKTPAALYLAAQAAKASLKGRQAPPASRREEEEHEDDRRRRADAQDGRSRGRSTAEDTSDMLGPEAKELISKMGITEDEYKASAKQFARRSGRR